jgi:hypothetical protein
VPDDMDGRVLEELFEPEFLGRQPIQTRSGYSANALHNG